MPPRQFPFPFKVGTDICSVQRIFRIIAEQPYSNNYKFVRRILSAREREAKGEALSKPLERWWVLQNRRKRLGAGVKVSPSNTAHDYAIRAAPFISHHRFTPKPSGKQTFLAPTLEGLPMKSVEDGEAEEKEAQHELAPNGNFENATSGGDTGEAVPQLSKESSVSAATKDRVSERERISSTNLKNIANAGNTDVSDIEPLKESSIAAAAASEDRQLEQGGKSIGSLENGANWDHKYSAESEPLRQSSVAAEGSASEHPVDSVAGHSSVGEDAIATEWSAKDGHAEAPVTAEIAAQEPRIITNEQEQRKAGYDSRSLDLVEEALEKMYPEILDIAQFLAGRFAAKEAVIKAYENRRLTYHDIRILTPRSRNGMSMKPVTMVVSGNGDWDDAQIVPVSISHDGGFATAVCMVYEESHGAVFETADDVIEALGGVASTSKAYELEQLGSKEFRPEHEPNIQPETMPVVSVGNIPRKISMKELKDLFGPIKAKIRILKPVNSDDIAARSALAYFSTTKEASQAVERADNTLLRGRRIRCELQLLPLQLMVICVQNIAPEASFNDLKQLFGSKAWNVNILGSVNDPAKHAYVYFETEEDALKTVKIRHNTLFYDRRIQCQLVPPRPGSKAKDPGPSSNFSTECEREGSLEARLASQL